MFEKYAGSIEDLDNIELSDITDLFAFEDFLEYYKLNPDIPWRCDEDDKTTLLHHAAMDNRTDIIGFLLAHGADIHAVDSGGDTPLHKAVRNCNPEAVEALLAAGARPDVPNSAGFTPIQKVQHRPPTWDIAIRMRESFEKHGYPVPKE